MATSSNDFEKMPQISRVSVNSMIDLLSRAYLSLLRNERPLSTLPSIMLWSAPGLGKSQGVRQLAVRIEQESGKQVLVTDVRLLLFNPVDLRGIPVPNEERTAAVWLLPKIFAMNSSPSVVNILFLDEISAAPPSVQAAAYQITLDRSVGEHKLPENCLVIAAGNRVTDRSVAYKMPMALANRLCHLEIECDAAAWCAWGKNAKIHPIILSYLARRPDQLMRFEPESGNFAFPTPRSWEMVSKLLVNADGDLDSVYPLVAGCIGLGAAGEFKAFATSWFTLPQMKDIFSGKSPKAPTRLDTLHALVSAMSAYADAHKQDLRAIEHSVNYAIKNLPPEFLVLLMRDYLAMEPDYRKSLVKMPAFQTWLQRYGALL